MKEDFIELSSVVSGENLIPSSSVAQRNHYIDIFVPHLVAVGDASVAVFQPVNTNSARAINSDHASQTTSTEREVYEPQRTSRFRSHDEADARPLRSRTDYDTYDNLLDYIP